MITIVIADDHQLFRQGLKRLLSDEGHYSVIGEASNGEEALELIRRLEPDVAVLDLVMPRPDGIEVTAQVTTWKGRTKCIILTMTEEIHAVRRALAVGAKGYVLKVAKFEEIASAIARVMAGKLYLGKLQDSPELFSAVDGPALTSREEEVLRQVALGLTSRQIAANLCISHRTVETHRQNIMCKLDIRNAAALVVYAREQGLI